ncbi:hypothetical protein [Streptomyces sp. DH8]|uniref:hypothetical protein n=1 Tax=Streptomyces sp. DH8 TaxID=2857008 RepID=UPI001E631D34|nr:hypothetical protein [Streptomyces sp. DH8]
MTYDIGRALADFDRRLKNVEAQSRLKSASLDDTALVVRDSTGSLRGIVGQQGDGTTAVTIVNGPPPPQPSAPIALSVLGGVAASWDGLFTDGVLPLDWSRTEVHASPDDGFTPTAVTLQSTIETAQGATVIVPTDDPVYVRFVARSTSGTASAPSAQTGPYGPEPVVVPDGTITTLKLADDAVTAAKVAAGAVGTTALADGAVLTAKLANAAVAVGKIADGAVTSPTIATNAVTAGKIDAGAITAREIAAGSITTEKLIVTGGAELLADPSFEGAATANLVAGNAFWAVDATKGNGSPKSLRVTATAGSPTNRDLALFDMAARPGDQLALSVDYQASSDYVGTPRIYARWENSSGGFLAAGAAQASPPVTGATWQTISATITAPPNAARFRLNLASTSGTSGQLWFDNASVRPVLGGTQIQDGAITTAKIVAGAVQTLQLDAEAVNASKIAAGAVSTAQLDALAVNSDKIAANAIITSKLAAGSVDATALKADAITGKTITGGTITGTTITGSTIQTATTGKRLVMNPDGHLLMFSGRAGGETPGELVTGVNTDGEMELGYVVIKPPTHGPVPPEFTMTIGPAGERQWFAGPLMLIADGSGSTAYMDGNISLTGQITKDAAWSTLSTGTGWVGYGGTYGPGRYRRMPDGSVFLRDLINRTATTTPTNGEIVATLPVGYRPTTTVQQNTFVGGSTGGSLSVNINTNGTITLTNFSSGATTYLATGNGYLSLNGYQYFTD